MRRGLNNPVDAVPLSRLVKKGEKVCIVIGDITRLLVSHHVLLPLIHGELNRGGVEDSDILIISATGDHSDLTPDEHRKLVGEDVYLRIKVIDHRAGVK